MPKVQDSSTIFRPNVKCEVIKAIDSSNVVLMARVTLKGKSDHVFARYYCLNRQNVNVSLLSDSVTFQAVP